MIVALNETNQIQIEQKTMKKNSIGLLHQKMKGGVRVVTVKELPKEASDFDTVFKYADAYGQIRLGYIGNDLTEADGKVTKSFGSAIGGIVGIKSATYKGFGFNVAAYVSQDLPFLYDTDKRANDFLSVQNSSYAYLAEASLDYDSKMFQAKVGRFVVEMPFANSDDLRISRNSFEGAWAEMDYKDRLSSQLFYLQRWAGFDSQDEENSQNEFKKLVEGGKGMIGASLAYNYADESQASLWVHSIDKMADIFYGEISGVYGFDDMLHFDYGLQYALINQKDASNVDGSVYGAMLIGHFDDFFVGVAANYADVKEGKSVTNGFGGGPYFTSLDESTIAAASELCPGEDIVMTRSSLGYDAPKLYSSFEYAFGYMEAAKSSKKIKEHDFIYTFNKDEKWQIEAIFTHYKADSDIKFNRFRARIDYNF